MLVHCEIPEPFKANVREEYLFDMDQSYVGKFRRMKVFGVSSYAGHVPTFSCLGADGTVFSYMPPSAIQFNTENDGLYGLSDLVYHNCPSIKISVIRYNELDKPLNAYIRNHNTWLAGDYLFTIDWYDGNDLLHCVALENGQCAFLPSHKIKFNKASRSFEPFKKLHQTWKV